MRKHNYGYYGGPNCRFISHPISAMAYKQAICSLCDKKALYRCGRSAYCKDHKMVAVNKLKIRRNFYEEKAKASEGDR